MTTPENRNLTNAELWTEPTSMKLPVEIKSGIDLFAKHGTLSTKLPDKQEEVRQILLQQARARSLNIRPIKDAVMNGRREELSDLFDSNNDEQKYEAWTSEYKADIIFGAPSFVINNRLRGLVQMCQEYSSGCYANFRYTQGEFPVFQCVWIFNKPPQEILKEEYDTFMNWRRVSLTNFWVEHSKIEDADLSDNLL